MADDDKKNNGENDAVKEGAEDAHAEVVPDAEAAATEGATGEGPGEPESEGTEASEDSGDSKAGEPEPGPTISLEALARISRGQTGQIHLHFRDRDVVVIGDGGAAAEVFDQFANRRTPGAFSAGKVNWLNSWFSYDLRELLGVSWYPRDLAPERRPVIDPVVPEPA